MTLIDAIIALLVLSCFLLGFAQIILPAFTAWNNEMTEYYAAKTMFFIAESFKNECAKPERNIDKWRKDITSAKELESCEIIELLKEDCVFALKAICVIAGEEIEIIGLCSSIESAP